MINLIGVHAKGILVGNQVYSVIELEDTLPNQMEGFTTNADA